MKKCTILLALVAVMAVSPLVVSAHCGSCGTSDKKEEKKSCCADKNECKKDGCPAKKSCTKEACKDGCKCAKDSAEAKKSGCGNGSCKKDK